ncbi:type II secretion system F family protein [Adlercreutzia sp. ZJ473]|uniref:type II secretion system F family protein n=1 Tax=Adlercreutzia sp. ZJ473 TaxID=2722822 RepID=UPI0015528B6E|nr:type II secretion system F family protein [Adlercreutzia sp. ZJ473]
MGAASFWAVTAALLALAAGCLAGAAAWRAALRWRLSASALASSSRERAFLILCKGCAPLRPVARRLLRVPAVAEASRGAASLAGARGYVAGAEELLSSALGMLVCASAAAWALSGSAACGAAVGCCAVGGVVAALRSAADKRSLSMREEVPEALRCMGVCFRSGLSLLQTLQQTSHEVKGPLGDLFAAAARRVEMGAPTSEALEALRDGHRVPELAFVAVALDVQHQSGGSVAPVLEAARESVEGELELMRSLRVQTAQAKLSARIVTLMPFVLVALFSLASSDFLAPFFSSFVGVALLGVALAMQAAGVLIVRRMLRVEAG